MAVKTTAQMRRHVRSFDLSKVNLTTIRTILSVLNKTHPRNFSLTKWFTSPIERIQVLRQSSDCGYTACIGGHLAIEEKLGLYIHKDWIRSRDGYGSIPMYLAGRTGIPHELMENLIMPTEGLELYGGNFYDGAKPSLKKVIKAFEIIQEETRKLRQ